MQFFASRSSWLLIGCILLFSACSPQLPVQKADTQIPPTSSPVVESPVLNILLTGATVHVPDSKFSVKLTKEHRTAQFGDNVKNPYAGFGSVTIGDQAVEADKVIFSTIAVNNGGSGEFFYLAAFEQHTDGWQMTATAPLADRIQFQTLSLVDQGVAVQYLDHSPNQAMVDMPNMQINKIFTYKNKKLILDSH